MERSELILLALERRIIGYEFLNWARTCHIRELEKLVEETPIVLSDDDASADDTRRAIVELRATGASGETVEALTTNILAPSIVASTSEHAPETLARHARTIEATKAPTSIDEIAKACGVTPEQLRATREAKRKREQETDDVLEPGIDDADVDSP